MSFVYVFVHKRHPNWISWLVISESSLTLEVLIKKSLFATRFTAR
jgi:hypothetical protein